MRIFNLRLTIIAVISLLFMTAKAQEDSIKHWGAEVEFLPGKAINMDEYQKKWMKGNNNYTFGIRVNYISHPCDSDDFAADYDYPTISAGIRYSRNNNITMHRNADEAWPLIEPVDYDSRMGDIITFYGMFSRPFFRTKRWEADYSLAFGVGYSNEKYNTHNAIDNELIGSRWLIYFGAGLHATYRVAANWGLKAGLEFYHHSNGALNRPNKGANILAPSVALCYYPYMESLTNSGEYRPSRFNKYWYCNFTLGVGGKTLLEDWQKTQFETAPGEDGYRTDKFKFHAAYSMQIDVMCRYARRWASGIGADIFYGTYSSYIEDMDRQQGHTISHSPWSVGIAAKHNVYYHNISLAMSLGYYLYREMGHNASINEKPYYERIGLHYTFPSLGGLTIGCNVKAHLTKADLTEFVISYPIKFKK